MFRVNTCKNITIFIVFFIFTMYIDMYFITQSNFPPNIDMNLSNMFNKTLGTLKKRDVVGN